MAWTQPDLDALSAAITAGVRSVTYADGRKIEYHSLDEMRRLRSDMKAEIAATASRVTPRRRTTVGRIRR
jgi:hypothetical protein